MLVGTSGWQYRDWRGAFYPQDLAQREWLGFYAGRFPVVEINNSFYRLPSNERFATWASGAPEDFVFCPKISRFLSHMKKLSDPEEPVERFTSAAKGLGTKLGPVLLQLPGNFSARPERLDRALGLLTRHLPLTVELRHPSWFSDEVRAILERHGVPLCWTDRLGRPQGPLWRTADWGYVRLHEGAAKPRPHYGDTALRSWADRILDGFGPDPEVYVFFNNDPHTCAPRDAGRFAELSSRAGLTLAA